MLFRSIVEDEGDDGRREGRQFQAVDDEGQAVGGRVPQGHPVIVDYFYHEEIRGTENTGKRNR